MSDIWKSISYLVRCDEGAVRLASQLKDWIDETNRVFLGIANGLPHLQREIEDGKRALAEMHAKIADESAYRGHNSPRNQIVTAFVKLIEAHRQSQEELAEFAGYFDVVGEVRSALGSLAELMEDVECFSVNAIVQAHNAGDRGRGFSQVSREVVSLTKRASTEFERVRSLSQRIEQGLEEVREAVNRSHERFEELPIRVEQDIQSMFAALDHSRAEVLAQVEKLTADVAESARSIGGVLVGLQFDDRCSQISHHLSNALSNLHAEIGELTNQDNKMIFAGEDVTELIDAVCFGIGVFDVVDQLVASLEDDLAFTRNEMTGFLENLALDLNRKAEASIQVDELMGVINETRNGMERFIQSMRELIALKAEIVGRTEALANQIYDLRDDLEGVRRTAKRFGVMASIIKVELASAGLSDELGEALSADRVENLYRDMASAVGSVLISLDTTVKQVQRRCAAFRQGLVREEDRLRQAEGYANRLVQELDGRLVRYLNRGDANFKNTLAKLHREATGLRLEVSNIISLGRQSSRIKVEARARAGKLREVRAELLEILGLTSWEIHRKRIRDILADCTVQAQREVVHNTLMAESLEGGDAGGTITLF